MGGLAPGQVSDLGGGDELNAAFAAAMDRLGPFEPKPALAVAVSGGADSMALALLALTWAEQRDGAVHALVVDHGLRPESAEEARVTVDRLGASGILSTIFTLTGLHRGPAMAERARAVRYEALREACQNRGWLHLLLGHHAVDQAETLMMRALSQSFTQGLAAMPALAEMRWVRLLRPLLAVDPSALRAFLVARKVGWVEDPSNRDRRALRPRLRQGLMQRWGPGTADQLGAAIRTAGHARARDDAAAAVELAARVTVRPEGFAEATPGRIGVVFLARLIRTVSGAPYPASIGQIADLAAAPRPATVAGVRLLRSDRFGGGLLVVREEAAVGEPVAACRNAVWDRRFRLVTDWRLPEGATIAKLGSDAARFRRQTRLPSVVLRTLPAIWLGKELLMVPHLAYGIGGSTGGSRIGFLFDPPVPLAGPDFLPM